MFDNLMNGLFADAKAKIELKKKELAKQVLNFASTDKKINIKISLDGKIKDLSISPEVLTESAEMIEDLLVINLNKALTEAEKQKEKKLDNIQNEIIPNVDDLIDIFEDDELDKDEYDDYYDI